MIYHDNAALIEIFLCVYYTPWGVFLREGLKEYCSIRNYIHSYKHSCIMFTAEVTSEINISVNDFHVIPPPPTVVPKYG